MSVEGKTESLQTRLLTSCCLVPGLKIIPCSLKELPLHCPSCATDPGVSSGVSSSSQRRKLIKAPGLPPADVFAQLTVEQIVMSQKPTLIDRLISQNKTALIMESKARKRANRQNKDIAQMNGKRKSTTAEEHLQTKRLRSSKCDMKKNGQKGGIPSSTRKKKVDSDPTPSTNRYATRISMNKVRIPFSLRSGRKMADILKSKRKRVLKQQLQQNDSQGKGKQVDSNSNTFSGIDQHGEKVKGEENKPKRRRRKRCSMWVKKVKKPIRKVEDLPVLNKVDSEEEDQESDVEEEMELLMPTLEKQVDRTDFKLKDEEIKNEPSYGIPLVQEKGTYVVLGELVTRDPVDKDSELLLSENNQEIKTEEGIQLLKDSKLGFRMEQHLNQCDYITITSHEKQTCFTQNFSGTKEGYTSLHPLIENKVDTGSLQNSTHENVNSEKVSASVSSSETDHNSKIYDKKDQRSEVDKTPKSEHQNMREHETDLGPEIKIVNSFTEDINNLDETSNTTQYESQLETKVSGVKIHTSVGESDESVSDANNINFVMENVEKSEEKSCNDHLEIPPHKLENSEKNPNCIASIMPKVSESEMLNVESNLSCDLVEKTNKNDMMIVSNNKPLNEELPSSEADSTTDVLHIVGNSDTEMKQTTQSDMSVLPDSTKDVKNVPTAEIKLEKEDLSNGSEGSSTKSNDDNKEILKIGLTTKSTNTNFSEPVPNKVVPTENGKEVTEKMTVEQKQMKESVLQALGLKSLTAVSEQKQHCEEDRQKYIQQQNQRNTSGYTGTLKAVIKLNRTGDKKRTMVYRRNEDGLSVSDKLEYRICSDFPSTESVPITHLADMGYNRKGFHHKNTESVTNSAYVNTSSNVAPSTQDASEINGGDDPKGNKVSNLIIPEKSSSFSIHPGRLCSDVCSYCFGKFGSLDTPCHVAQIKGEERQKKILQNEPHLTPESCLCDACYRYVDRKVNYHPKSGNQQGTNQSSNGNAHKSHHQPQPHATCCVVSCSQQATHTIKRKWILKLKKNLTNKLEIDMDKHSGIYFPFCTQHHYWVEYLTVCGICRKRLNRNNLFSLGKEADRLNLMLAEDGIPARLSDNLFLCKLCRYYSNLRLKYSDTSAIPNQNKAFYKSYRRKILMSLDIEVSNSEDECEHSEESSTPEKKRGGGNTNTSVLQKKPCHGGNSVSTGTDNPATTTTKPTTIKTEHPAEEMVSLTELATLFGEQPEPPQQTRIQVKFGNVNIGTLSNLNIGQQGGGTAPVTGSADKERSDGVLSCNLEFQGPSNPEASLERCVSTIQFDKKAKQLWTELQRPYGTQSLFLRHLIMMEKIWRSGYLVLSSNADEKAVKYVLNAKNKVRTFESSSSSVGVNTTATASPLNNGAQVRPTPPKAKEISQTNAQPIRVRQLQPQQLTKVQNQLKQPHQQQQKKERYPILNTGEIEVTPVKSTTPTQIPINQSSSVTVTSTNHFQYIKPQTIKLEHNQIKRPMNHQSTSVSHQLQHNVLQQQLMAKKLSHLDRAKSLVRMAMPQPRPSSGPPPRYYVPAAAQTPIIGHQQQQQYLSSNVSVGSTGGNGSGSSNNGAAGGSSGGSSSGSIVNVNSRPQPPPLMKLQSYYQHQQQINQQSALQQLPYQLQHFQQHPRTILPKLPKSLTVVSRVNSKPTAITLRHSGITIEKQSSVPPLRSSHPLPVEKPIISVFREPAVSPQQH